MKEYLVLLKRELKSITKEKTIMFAIIIQFLIASLSSIIMVGIMAFYDPSSISQNAHVNLRIGLVEEDQGIIRGLLQHKGIASRPFANLNAAEEAFKAGKIDAIMVIPTSQSGVVDMKLVLPELDSKQTVIMMLLQEPLKNYENFLRYQNGVTLHYDQVEGKPSNTYEFLYTLIIPILMLFPALIAGSIMIDTISEEFENKTFDTLMAAPVSLGQVFAAKISAAIVTAIGQVILWTILLRLNGFVIQDPVLVLLVAVMAATAIAFIAAFVALIFKDRERAQFIYSIVLVFLVAGSYFLGPSPLNMITRISAGVQNTNSMYIGLYLLALVIVGAVFFKTSKKLTFSK